MTGVTEHLEAWEARPKSTAMPQHCATRLRLERCSDASSRIVSATDDYDCCARHQEIASNNNSCCCSPSWLRAVVVSHCKVTKKNNNTDQNGNLLHLRRSVPSRQQRHRQHFYFLPRLATYQLLLLIVWTKVYISKGFSPMNKYPSNVQHRLDANKKLIGGRILPSHNNKIHRSTSWQTNLFLQFDSNFQNSQDDQGDSLSSESTSSTSILPRHVAFICDGNARWATARGLSASAGHKAGADRCLELIEALRCNNSYSSVEYCTFFGFSTENWQRPHNEVYEILKVLEHTARQMLMNNMQQQQQRFVTDATSFSATPSSSSSSSPLLVPSRPVRLRILGDLTDERLPWGLREVLQRLEQETRRTTSATATTSSQHPPSPPPLTVCLALNYGGRQDIVKASMRIAEALAQGTLDAKDVTEEIFSSMLCTDDIPDPDLMVRTSGEYRISNFLLWNAAYAELYFTNTLWPDFDERQLEEAMHWYLHRCRRFGARSRSATTNEGGNS